MENYQDLVHDLKQQLHAEQGLDVRVIDRAIAWIQEAQDELEDLHSEIERHHGDFTKWENMAADGVDAQATLKKIRQMLEDYFNGVEVPTDSPGDPGPSHSSTVEAWRHQSSGSGGVLPRS